MTRSWTTNSQIDWNGGYRQMSIRTAMLIDIPRRLEGGECTIRTMYNTVVKDFEVGGDVYLLHMTDGTIISYGWNDQIKVYWNVT